MRSSVNNFIFRFIYLVALLFTRCAQVGVLTGGPPDIHPPKVIKTSPSNPSLNFHNETIKLFFDEPIQIKNPFKEISIYPYSDSLIKDINSSSKSLVIKINLHKLQPNTTYQIHFGNAITDLHEGNVLKGYVYVFSTGSSMDTLSFSGKIEMNGFEKLPNQLYAALFDDVESHEDSVLINKMPAYLTIVNNQKFTFQHLSPGEYRLAVSEYSPQQHKFLNPFKATIAGRLPDKINITKNYADTVTIPLMKVYPIKSPILRKEFHHYGKIKVRFKEPTWAVLKNLKGETLTNSLNGATDSLIYWLNDTSSIFTCLVSYFNYPKPDTLRLYRDNKAIRLEPMAEIKEDAKRRIHIRMTFPGVINKMNFEKCFGVYFLRKKDSVWVKQKPENVFDSLNVIRFEVNLDTFFLRTCRIVADSFCFYCGGMLNNTTVEIKRSWDPQSGKYTCGILHAKIKFNKKGNYVLMLLNENGRLIFERKITLALNSPSEADFSVCLPDKEKYLLECVYDDDGNGFLTEGNFWKKTFPERKIRFNKKIQIMNEWEIFEAFEMP
ncbi:MAG: Ig-like domain-containing protein [Bacteroidia bacterium]|nr:Ig-like domain-containing protein [Bacteroidia bacterium]